MGGAELVLQTGNLIPIVRLEIEDAVSMRPAVLLEVFRAIGVRRIAGVMLCGATGGDIKAGRAFHRLASIRDAGLCDAILIEAADCASAEWLVENTPINGISIPYDMSDQTARYRVLPAAEQLGIAVLAYSTAPSLKDVRMQMSDPQITSAIIPLPRNAAELNLILAAIKEPVDETWRANVWDEFRARVPEPARPRGQHPPEFEA